MVVFFIAVLPLFECMNDESLVTKPQHTHDNNQTYSIFVAVIFVGLVVLLKVVSFLGLILIVFVFSSLFVFSVFCLVAKFYNED